ncbi:sterol desaturase family protein [Qipengyuania marisflavi]|uniref:Sterol desaturase family protein n=1 Tax=Qipengyuania marisflavi TaxID=2486356 RepID=A0A5S3P9I2_9SPHN|nr:sterol desaturase family protein [Qipengyuania marisflavi]TMM50154.1 sterol desaturase family protein [Qipengyuania marisflavi]
MEMFADHAMGMLTTVGVMAVVFGLLALAMKRAAIVQAMHGMRGEFATNLGMAIINLILLAPLFTLSQGTLHGLLGAPASFVAFWDGMNELLVLVLAILVYDFVAYWRHRLEHHPLLWRIHATHHADTQLHWLSLLRKHPLAHFLAMALDLTLLLLLGFPAWAVGLASLIRSFWGYFIHADVPWTLGLAGRWLMSPAAHRLHHIRDEELMGSNYANTVTLWDRLFGTYVDPAPYLGCETGIAEGTRGLLGELARPWEKRYRRSAKAAAEHKAVA